MTNEQPRQTAELAALFMSGALSPDEQQQLLVELAQDGSLPRELKELQAVVHALVEEIDPIEPAPEVKQALMQFAREHKSTRQLRGHHQVWRGWQSDEPEGLFTVRAADMPWEETGVEGIQVRRLFVDQEHDRMTVLFRMAPGSSYVPHRHEGPEECYVLEGELHVDDDLVLRAGDYQRAEGGSRHGVQRTESGCVILVTCSMHDEPV
jgi:anti-sigma factor ChrR (cupin superfamily)